MGDTWFYAKGGQQVGPVSFAEVQALLANGGLRVDELVWTEGMPQWMPAGQVPQLGGMPPQVMPQPLAYGYQPIRPTSVTVLAVIGIILGSLGVLGTGCAVMFMIGARQQFQNQIQAPLAWLAVSALIGVAMCVLLLASSIAALKLIAWGRKGMLAYAMVGIVMNVVNAVVNLIYMDSSKAAFMVGVALGGLVIGMIYPVCVLVFMKKPHVVAAFESGGAFNSPGV